MNFFLLFVLSFVLVQVICDKVEQATDQSPNMPESEFADQSESRLEPESIYVPDVCAQRIKIGDRVGIHLVARWNNGHLFCDTRERNIPLEVPIDLYYSRAIEEVLIGRCIGERIKVVIPKSSYRFEAGFEGAENTESIEYDMEILYKGDSHTKALFDFVNTNGDDVLDLQEITNFAKKFTKKSLSQMPNMSLEKFIELYLEVRDKDKSGFLSWDECMYNENAEVKAASSDSSPLESDLSAPDSQTESKCETDPEGQCSLEDAPHPLSESKADFEADLEDDSEDDSEDDDDLEIETVESPKSPKPDFQQKMTFQFKNNKFEPINSDDDASFAAFKAKFEAQLKKQMAEKNQNPDSDWGTDLDLDFDMDSKDEL